MRASENHNMGISMGTLEIQKWKLILVTMLHCYKMTTTRLYNRETTQNITNLLLLMKEIVVTFENYSNTRYSIK